MEVSTNNKQLLVIGVGLGRTGTWSLTHALEMILPGKCLHMSKVMQYHSQEWADILTGKMTDEEFGNFFSSNNYVAATDRPFTYVWERALAVFPEAKVVLTVREPERWVESTKSTTFNTFQFEFPLTIFSMLGLFSTYLGHPRLNTKGDIAQLSAAIRQREEYKDLMRALTDGNGVKYYNKWVQDIEEKVPREKLLTFDVRDGWEPLCKFLDVPQPDAPFPKVNERAEFQGWLSTRTRRSWLLLYEIVSLPLLVYAFYKVSRK